MSNECHKRWQSLSDRYVRELKKMKQKKSGDAGSAYVSPWCLFEVLCFLKDSVRHKQCMVFMSNNVKLSTCNHQRGRRSGRQVCTQLIFFVHTIHFS